MFCIPSYTKEFISGKKKKFEAVLAARQGVVVFVGLGPQMVKSERKMGWFLYFVLILDVNIESPPSMHPPLRICDITGFECLNWQMKFIIISSSFANTMANFRMSYKSDHE
ncbi:hypothetical protein NC651_035872 [Populus alba x Populus x berolinensis]|nr:hypothetical protein NC651_035872 [Populus alba x Populus x berolinensis]